MLLMTEDEARTIIQREGWSYKERKPRRKAKYVYARRRQGGAIKERYICPLSRLNELTEAKLVAKLADKPAEKPNSTEGEPEVSNTTDPQTNTDEL